MSMRPVPEMYPVSQSYYGGFSTQFSGGARHGAIDFACPTGTPVLAPDNGVIVHADWVWNLPGGPNDWAPRWYQLKPAPGDTHAGGGIMTVLRNDLGSHWIMAHLSDNNMVKVGQRVKMGDVVGLSGGTGVATGPHLHLGLVPPAPDYNNGAYGAIDPAPFLTERYAPNKYVSWRGGATKGTGTASKPSTPVAAPRHGIDVSWHQPADIVKRVASDFVIVKATEGAAWYNDKLSAQINDAFAAGKRVGIYHFANVNNSSDAEAEYFLKYAKPFIDRGAVPVLDWEPGKLVTYTQWAEDWLRVVDARTRKTSIIYMNLVASRLSTWTAFAKARPFWLAYYGNESVFNGYATSFDPPKVPGWRLSMWQYSEHGRLPGYAGDLDLNVYFGGVAEWDKKTAAQSVDKELEEIMSWYKGGRRDFEGWIARKCRDAIQQMMPVIVANVWSYKNPKVNGSRDAYAVLTDIDKRVAALEKGGK